MADASKVVIVTGASSGMGEAVAVRLGCDGARVVLAARRADRLERVAERVREAGGEPLVCVTDVGRLDDIQTMVRRTTDAFGRIDVVFNNAGLMRVGPIEELSHQDIEEQVNINFLAAVRVIKEVIPILKQQNDGLIINISSVLGRKTRATAWVYAGTKWAVTAMSEGLREELVGTRIRVCSLQPGVVETELFATWPESPLKKFNITHPLRPENVADLVAYVVKQPWYVNVNEVLIRPTEQPI